MTDPRPIQCDMDNACRRPATYIDTAGFAYCEPHGLTRQRHEPCRKLRPHELARIQRGLPLARY